MLNRQNIILLLLVVVLAAAPLVMHKEASFGGSDDQAQEAIASVNPDYKPWMNVIWEPPSSETESFLFALQAAIGAGFIGYFFGYCRGRKTAQTENSSKDKLAPNTKLGLNGQG